MDRYQRVEKPRAETPIDENEIRITSQGRMRNYITYAMTLLQRISPKFQRHMLNELSETATLELKGSSKCSWTVLVSQIEGDIYIKNGWQKFIKDNPLGDFEFLLFRYERPMHFTIEIFDKTACMRNNLLEKSARVDNTKRPRGRPRKCNRSVDFSREHLPEGYYIAIYICNWLDKGLDEIVFKDMGRAINKTVTIVELIKRRIVGLHQYTTIGSTDITDTWEPLEEGLLPFIN